jgi:hypothetical protein
MSFVNIAGLIFVAYCVVCYLVTALLFSLLILDLAAFAITLAPSKAIFKYTDLVYTGGQKLMHTCAKQHSTAQHMAVQVVSWGSLSVESLSESFLHWKQRAE